MKTFVEMVTGAAGFYGAAGRKKEIGKINSIMINQSCWGFFSPIACCVEKLTGFECK